ncbi:MAG: acetylglutamate kinase [Actinomycetota bacterium]|nr:acetylglutamate kinase [Actinomycetota bacterium]
MTVTEATAKAQTLIEAIPYIRSYRNQTVVVKLGGEPLDDPVLAARLVEDIALLVLVGVRVVVVHGGGPQISRAMQATSVSPRFVDGLRVTDEATMTVVEQTLIGAVNPSFVGSLNRAGVRALGLSGVDAGCMVAEREVSLEGRPLGRVGRIGRVDPEVLVSLLDSGFTPVVATVAPSAEGETLNVNADAAAAAIAAALGAEKLIYVTNVEGLYRDLGDRDSLIPELKSGDLASFAGTLSAGMRPKAESALAAIAAGVRKVHILDGRVEHCLLLEIFTPEGVGTQVLP